jgi:hypothetical protein
VWLALRSARTGVTGDVRALSRAAQSANADTSDTKMCSVKRKKDRNYREELRESGQPRNGRECGTRADVREHEDCTRDSSTSVSWQLRSLKARLSCLFGGDGTTTVSHSLRLRLSQ